MPDGRTLGWAEYGAPTGTPVIELHGGGASHLSGLLYHREALDAGVRIIAVDRPGAGGSSPNPALAVATFHQDIRELAVHLGLRRFVALGNSNGGMFAVALAHAMPDLVSGAIPLNPATPVFDDGDAWAVTPLYHGLVKLPVEEVVAGMQLAARQFQEQQAQARVEDPFQQFPESTEPEIVDLYFQALAMTPTEVLEQEVKLVLDEAGWGFDIYDVQPRVELFTGLTEVGTPFNKLWAERLPNAGLHLTSGGHAGQTAPDTRRELMRCAVALSEGRVFRPMSSLTSA
ncbi:MAG: alpha/beta hydrolase [Gemmatimonadales bacterium]